ncbi:MAG: hypothetical protein H6617_10195 [Bdellovibrionaceae bacterium]|nr:hypothetical protein [Bdellovibrionales bacterium]MCB9255041.1 hypothetical protein [Pseudobdellovibrionaceae bacterium]
MLSERSPNQAGYALLSLLVAGSILSLSVLFAQSSLLQVRVQQVRVNRRLIAQSYATELIEYFRSMTNDLLLSYLRRTPSAASPYSLCQRVNEVDRRTGTIRLPDPLASLPQSATDNPVWGLAAANRYYQVEVLDRLSLTPVSAACGQSPSSYTRRENESFFVTVGVSWLDTDRGESQPHELTLGMFLQEP